MESSPIVEGFPPGDWPSMGSILSKQLGTRVRGVPAAVDLTPTEPDARFILRTPPTQPGYLGSAHAGFEVESVDRRNIRLNGTTLDRIADRQAWFNHALGRGTVDPPGPLSRCFRDALSTAGDRRRNNPVH